MAFDFGGGKKSSKTYDPTHGFDSFDTTEIQPEVKSSVGFSGFSFGDPKNKTSSTDLLDTYGGETEDTSFSHVRRSRDLQLDASHIRLIIIAVLVLVCVILAIVYWEQILKVLYTIGAVLIIAGIVLIIFRMMFPRRRR